MAPADEPRCPACGTRFLAYKNATLCPGCHRAMAADSGIVAEALRVYADNERTYGRAIPPVIRVQSLRDDYLYRALFFLKALDDRGPHETEESVILRSLEALATATDPGWRAHLEGFYREVLAGRHRERRD